MELENKINWEIHKCLDSKQDTSQYPTGQRQKSQRTQNIF